MSLNEKVLGEVRKIFTAYLDKKELRKTPERFSILDQVYKTNDHFDVDSLYSKLKRDSHRISRATVYNTLDILVEWDLVSKHQFGKNLAQFEKAYGYKQHDHLICTDCHKVVEFCDPRIQNIQNTVGDLLEFKIMHHSLILYASCKKNKCENKLVNELSAWSKRWYLDNEIIRRFNRWGKRTWFSWSR